MGIYGALSTAVSGLRAQAFALENISGNIANSQTVGYKRIETSFVDLIPDAPVSRQIPGAVLAQSRATNDSQGDINTSSIETFMAMNGSGFFVVEPQIGQADGNALFSGADFYTRRGDFQLNRQGYLVNGAGYFLKGLPIDASTGNVSGSVPQVIEVSNAFLPAQKTSRINYALNLPLVPKNPSYQAGVLGSELLKASHFMAGVAPDQPARLTGATLTGTDDAATVMPVGETLTVRVGDTEMVFEFFDGTGGATYSGANMGIDVQAGVTIAEALASVEDRLRASGGSLTGSASVGLNQAGEVEMSLGGNIYSSMQVASSANVALGLASASADPVRPSLNARVASIRAQDDAAFKDVSVTGGGITVFADNGSPVSVQLRWAKIDSAETGGEEVWNLFYQSNANANGSAPMWTNVGVDYRFAANGSLVPAIESVEIPAMVINGVPVGNITINHGAKGVTQFSDPGGTVNVTTMAQNGYGAGEFQSVGITDGGRIVASYSNGQRVDLAQVVTANFNAPNQLKRMDGGAFAATADSGTAILDITASGVIGASIEASNTDISEEFTKLIVTQQAYAASTRIVSTADEMLREALNMVR